MNLASTLAPLELILEQATARAAAAQSLEGYDLPARLRDNLRATMATMQEAVAVGLDQPAPEEPAA